MQVSLLGGMVFDLQTLDKQHERICGKSLIFEFDRANKKLTKPKYQLQYLIQVLGEHIATAVYPLLFQCVGDQYKLSLTCITNYGIRVSPLGTKDGTATWLLSGTLDQFHAFVRSKNLQAIDAVLIQDIRSTLETLGLDEQEIRQYGTFAR